MLYSAPAIACGWDGYSYAGVESVRRSHGIAATISVSADSVVRAGHVAGWVGVGGYGEAAGGADAWLQVGLSRFAGSSSTQLYYEVARPGREPEYHLLRSLVGWRERHRVAVLETRRAGWWRVWVDGVPASEPIAMPGSHNRWRPVATGESWDGGTDVCNSFGYRFDKLSIATRAGGGWQRLTQYRLVQAPGFRIRRSLAGFLATSG